jgi:hypothetical protein
MVSTWGGPPAHPTTTGRTRTHPSAKRLYGAGVWQIVIAVVFWILIVHAVIGGANRKVIVLAAGIWVALYLLRVVFPVFSSSAAVLQAVLLVVIAVWLKATNNL